MNDLTWKGQGPDPTSDRAFSSLWESEDNSAIRDLSWPFPEVQQIKILGDYFTPAMNFEYHIEEMIKSCLARMRILKRISGGDWGLGAPLIISSYKALVLSKIL